MKNFGELASWSETGNGVRETGETGSGNHFRVRETGNGVREECHGNKKLIAAEPPWFEGQRPDLILARGNAPGNQPNKGRSPVRATHSLPYGVPLQGFSNPLYPRASGGAGAEGMKKGILINNCIYKWTPANACTSWL